MEDTTFVVFRQSPCPVRLSGMNRLLILAAVLAVALVAAAGAGATASQTVIPYQPGDPQTNGCPAGWEALALSDLAPYGYGVPSMLDPTANGGNGDGIVCGHPWTAAEQAARLQNAPVPVVFDFEDNALPATSERQLVGEFCSNPVALPKPGACISLSYQGRTALGYTSSDERQLTLTPGTYWLTVDDTSRAHNFALQCPDGSERDVTGVADVPGWVSVKVTLEPGAWVLFCSADDHRADGMYVDIQVGGIGQTG